MDSGYNRRDFLRILAAQAALLGLRGASWAAIDSNSIALKDGTYRTFCKFCSFACGITLTIEKCEITNVRGMLADPRTGGVICPQAQRLGQFLAHPDRVVSPLVRTGKKGEGTFASVSWIEALQRVKETWSSLIQEQGPETIFGYMGETVGFESLWLMPRLFNCLGSPNVFNPSLNIAGGFAFAGAATTGALAAESLQNVTRSRCIILWGCNPTVSKPMLLHWIKSAQQRGAKLIVINPKRIPLAGQADLWIPVRPGTDGALALSIAQVLISHNLQDRDFLQKWSVGYEAFRELAFRAGYKPDEAAELCHISPDQIIKAAQLYGGKRPSLIIGGLGLSSHSQGFQAARAVHCLASLTGNVNKPGANLYYSFPVPPLQGIPALGNRRQARGERNSKAAATLPLGFPDTLRLWDLILADGDDRSWSNDVFRLASSEARPPYNTNQVYKKGYFGTAYPVRSLLLLRGDPLSTLPNTIQGKMALAKVEFLVAATHFVTPSARYADVIFPLAYPPECSEVANSVFPNPHKYLLLREQLLPTPGTCLSEQDLLITLGRTMGFHDEFAFTHSQFVDHVFSASPRTRKLTYEALQENPLKIFSLFSEEKLFPHPYQVAFPTSSGKVEFASSGLEGSGFNPLPEWAPPVEGQNRTPEFAESFPLTLITGRAFPTTPNDQAVAILSPADANAYNIKNGDMIRIESKVGSGRFTTKVSADVIPGVVWISTGTHLYEPFPPAENAITWQHIIDHRFNDAIVGSPRTNEMPVRIVRIS